MTNAHVETKAMLQLVVGTALLLTSFAVAHAKDSVGSVVRSYEAEDGATISIVSFGDRKNNEVLVYFDGFDTSWDKRAFVHKSEQDGKKLVIVRGAHRYETFVDYDHKTFRNGSVVSLVQVYCNGYKGKKEMWPCPAKLKPEDLLKAKADLDDDYNPTKK